ncbi:MAG: DNA translocase FtsK [Bacilli bacterium]
MGAEKLLGKGDMLFLPMGESAPLRIQGAFVSDEEIKRIVDYTISQQKAEYDEQLINLNATPKEINEDYGEKEEYDDPLYNEIVEFVITTGKASASLIQRKYRLGYNRAARIVDLLEERGIVGPSNGSKPRDVLIQLDKEEE